MVFRSLIIFLTLSSFEGKLFFFNWIANANSRERYVEEEIDKLHPLQAVVGYEEVKRKTKKIKDFDSKTEREDYFIKNTIPVIVGPGGQLYILDHHHFALAVYNAGFSKVFIKQVADYSRMSTNQFWTLLKRKKWVYLRDNGVSIDPTNLPEHVKDLKDDPYRSLAGRARQNGAFLKTKTPFAEFIWADYFRERIKVNLIQNDFKKAVSLAVDLAKDPEASNLPGFSKNAQCVELYYGKAL